MSNILIKDVEILSSGGQTASGNIAITGANIVSVGDIPANWQADRVIDGTNKLAIPGFVNAHTHAAMSLFRSYADDMALMDWLKHKIWPIEAKLTPDDIYWGTMLAIAEMLKSGTTTFADMYFYMPQAAAAVADSGMRAVLARGMSGITPNAQQALAESEAFFHEFNNAADGRITAMLGPHAPYTCPPAYLKQVVSVAQRLGAEIHIHLAETQGEVADCMKEYGKTPIALMAEVGVFDCGVLAAHCVHVSAEDIQIMRDKHVRVAHNPGSNMKLASGIAPLTEMLAAGVCVGLGTDGAASNNNLDMLEETRLAALLHKVSSFDPLAIPAGLAIDLATTAGAQAVGLGEITGKLTAGYRADITLIDMQNLHWQPRHDRTSLLVYASSASDVHTVLVDGQVLLDNRHLTTIDEERLVAEISQRVERLTRRSF